MTANGAIRLKRSLAQGTPQLTFRLQVSVQSGPRNQKLSRIKRLSAALRGGVCVCTVRGS